MIILMICSMILLVLPERTEAGQSGFICPDIRNSAGNLVKIADGGVYYTNSEVTFFFEESNGMSDQYDSYEYSISKDGGISYGDYKTMKGSSLCIKVPDIDDTDIKKSGILYTVRFRGKKADKSDPEKNDQGKFIYSKPIRICFDTIPPRIHISLKRSTDDGTGDKGMKLKMDITDEGSGIRMVEVCAEGKELIKERVFEKNVHRKIYETAFLTMKNGEKSNLYMMVTDNAGNITGSYDISKKFTNNTYINAFLINEPDEKSILFFFSAASFIMLQLLLIIGKISLGKTIYQP